MLNDDDDRPRTPDTPLTSSIYHATTTIDDLTHALTHASRIPSPEPTSPLTCCCGRSNCETTANWLDLKSKLETRLVLSAEVGQALLQRHEAYIRRHERTITGPNAASVDTRIAELAKENAILERRLSHALLNTDVAESANKAAQEQLAAARASLARLSADQARSAGWDTRLAAIEQELDDMHQERDAAAHRARAAESKVAFLEGREEKLEVEINRLQDELEQRRVHRLELSDSLLQDARSQLERLQSDQVHSDELPSLDIEVARILEELVVDNEGLRRESAELQTLLADCMEDVRMLREEVDERRAARPPATPRSRHVFTPTSLTKDPSYMRSLRRPTSLEHRSRRLFMPLTPDTDTDADTLVRADSSLGAGSLLDADVEEDRDAPSTCPSPTLYRPRPRRSLAHSLLTRDTGVQTEPSDVRPAPPLLHISTPSLHSNAPESAHPHSHSHSESSSLFDAPSSSPSSHGASLSGTGSGVGGPGGTPTPLALALVRASSLLARLNQADARTLTARLRRQRLRGADVAHLSRSTVGVILGEAAALRAQFRYVFEDPGPFSGTTSVGSGPGSGDGGNAGSSLCTRRDLRALFAFVRDAFAEMGALRITLNEVILDPACAPRVSAAAMNDMDTVDVGGNGTSAAGWMGPLSKLFGAGVGIGGGESGAASDGSGRPASRGRDAPRRSTGGPVFGPGGVPSARVIPKLGPALAASTTTVNVEFSGTAAGRSVASTFSAHPDFDPAQARAPSPAPTPGRVMEIFAGAPRAPFVDPSDPWVVVSRGSPLSPSVSASVSASSGEPSERRGSEGLGTLRRMASRVMSRQVDAVVDTCIAQDTGVTTSSREIPTLRRRGLSDSSIHSTFTQQSQGVDAVPQQPSLVLPHEGGQLSTNEQAPERASMLQTLSRTFKLDFGSTLGQLQQSLPPPPRQRQPHPQQPASRVVAGLLPVLPSWMEPSPAPPLSATSSTGAEAPLYLGGPSSLVIGSPRGEDGMQHRTWARTRDF